MSVEFHTIWWLLALGLGLAELFTGTFFLVFVAVGAGIAGIAAFFGLGVTWQLIAAAIGALAGAVWLRFRQKASAIGRDVSLDVGARVEVIEWASPRRTEVRYRGATWQVELEATNSSGKPGEHIIRQVNGNILIVTPSSIS